MVRVRYRSAGFLGAAVATAGVLVAFGAGHAAEDFSVKLPGDQPMPRTLPAVSPDVLGQLGVAPTPRGFPSHTDQDVRDMIAESSRLGSVAVLIYQWGDPNLHVVSNAMIQRIRSAGMTPVVGLSPTTLASSRKKLDVPKHLRGGFFRKPSFGSDEVRAAFVAESVRLAKLDVPYLCLATEINFLALQRMPEFLEFVEAYKEAYRAVKKVAPNTKVFVSFVYEWMRVVDQKEPGRIEEHARIIDIFRPELDIFAITSYPCDWYDDPTDMPRNYYTHLRRYLKPGEQVMVMEIGWPSAGKGSVEEQRRFIERLPVLMADISPVITAWSLLHDVKLGAFGENLASTGLRSSSGAAKDSLAAFANMKRPPERK